MKSFTFDWNPQKAATNLAKHNVSFDEASTIFDDILSYTFADKWHSIGEQREITIGYSSGNRLLIVVSTERESVIRIISAREANKHERKEYEHNAF